MSTSTQAEVYAPESLLSAIEVRARSAYDQGLFGLAPEGVTIEYKSMTGPIEGGPVVKYSWDTVIRNDKEALSIYLPNGDVEVSLKTHEILEGGYNTNIYDLNVATCGLVTYTHSIVRTRQELLKYVAFQEHEVPYDVQKRLLKYTRALIVRSL